MADGIDLTTATTTDEFVLRSAPQLRYIYEWARALPTISLADDLTTCRRPPAEVAICSVDMIEGFCHQGALASDRVRDIVPAVVDLFSIAHAAGIDKFLLIQDAHRADAVEFGAFPPHCVHGTTEAETIPELATLPFANHFTHIPKNSISAGIATTFGDWLDAHPQVRYFICVGDVTDLCLYQLATYLKLRANAYNLDWQVVVPANCTQTYDMPLDLAHQLGAMPHDGDFFHLTFLYHLALNGVRVVRHIAA